MEKKEGPNYWFVGSAVAGAVVATVATLVLTIIAAATSIRANAARIEKVAEEIVASTRSIWELGGTDATSARLLDGARSIEQHAREVADALSAPPSETR